jgi:RNA polymerase sigma factor (sigma-70 family)
VSTLPDDAPPDEAPSDLASRLIQDVRGGVPGAWERLIDTYGGLVLSIARGTGLREADCEEVYQETWASLFEQIHALRRPAGLIKWISSTAHRQSLFLLKRRSRQRATQEVAEDVEGSEREPELNLLEVEEAHIVRDVALAMDEPCRTLFEELFFARETPSYAALGRRIGRPKNSIGRVRDLCLAELAGRLERRGFR